MKAVTAPVAVPLWRDLVALAKPRIILLLAITCLCGGLVAAKGNLELLTLSAWPLTLATLGLCVAAAGANSVNMAWDRDIDPLMQRTSNRPLPQGRLGHRFVYGWGSLLIALGTLLAATATLWAGLMNLAGALFYVFIYTMLLKRHTVQNIVIGGAAGAFPPLVGWAAVQGDISHPLPWLMFAVIFFWTPPHFWALALFMNADYTKAKIPMYPVVRGVAATRVMIVRYLMVLVPLTMLGGLYPPLGWLYSLSALVLGLWWGQAAWQLLQAPLQGPEGDRIARLTFRRSLYYLAWLFMAMVIDSLV